MFVCVTQFVFEGMSRLLKYLCENNSTGGNSITGGYSNE